ncbi:MAG TPA: hypothetical protein VNE21_06750 [Mycobacteriales bacterium]|nr:hypothetical protein [Mycobacteriales bacterium]
MSATASEPAVHAVGRFLRALNEVPWQPCDEARADLLRLKHAAFSAMAREARERGDAEAEQLARWAAEAAT